MISIEDKAFLLQFLHAPCFDLSPAQIMEIERVIDKRNVVDMKHDRCYYTYEEAMAALDFTTTAGIRRLAKIGRIKLYVPEGCQQAKGVTKESLDRYLGKAVAA